MLAKLSSGIFLLCSCTWLSSDISCLQNFRGNFEAWRWLLMVGVLVPIHHTGNLLVKMLVWAVEYIFVFQKKALYYLVGTKVGIQTPHTAKHECQGKASI